MECLLERLSVPMSGNRPSWPVSQFPRVNMDREHVTFPGYYPRIANKTSRLWRFSICAPEKLSDCNRCCLLTPRGRTAIGGTVLFYVPLLSRLGLLCPPFRISHTYKHPRIVALASTFSARQHWIGSRSWQPLRGGGPSPTSHSTCKQTTLGSTTDRLAFFPSNLDCSQIPVYMQSSSI